MILDKISQNTYNNTSEFNGKSIQVLHFVIGLLLLQNLLPTLLVKS